MLADEPDGVLWVCCDQALGDRRRIVRAAVVDDNRFPKWVRLRNHTCDGFRQEVRLLVTRDDNGDRRRRLYRHVGLNHDERRTTNDERRMTNDERRTNDFNP
jgi:hypothetical protein